MLSKVPVINIYYYSSSLPSPKCRDSGPASYGTEPVVPRASLGFAGLAQVLGNQLFQCWAIPLIGLLPPRGRAYLSYPINPWSWKCDFRAACPAPPGGGVVAPPMNLEKLGRMAVSVGVVGARTPWDRKPCPEPLERAGAETLARYRPRVGARGSECRREFLSGKGGRPRRYVLEW